MIHSFLLAVLCVAAFAGSAWAQEDTEEGSLPAGLMARYEAGGRAIERIDRDVLFDWETFSPDPRLPERAFRVHWTGRLLVRSSETYRFSAFVRGRVQVRIGETVVLEGVRSGSPQWIDGRPVPLEFGEQPLEIRYERTDLEASVRLFWSGDAFPLEPIPAQALLHPRNGEDHVDDRGSRLYRRLRCARCHLRTDESPALPGPSLAEARHNVHRDWLTSRLTRLPAPDLAAADRRGHVMPDFGFTRAEAESIADFVLQSPARSRRREREVPAGDSKRGETLFRSVGCLACHTHSGIGQSEVAFGPDLSQVSRKRDRNWMNAWLEDPAAIQPQTQMPAVRLTNAERADLVAFLAGEPAADTAKEGTAIAQGRKLFESARCSACHAMGDPALDGMRHDVPALHDRSVDAGAGCLSAEPDRSRRTPRFLLTPGDRKALQAHVRGRTGPLSPEGPFAKGERLLSEKNCLGCHDRDGQRGLSSLAAKIAGLDPMLQGQSEALIPPDLTAVGDRLHDAALAAAIAGESPAVRLPWLSVRMPRFQHAADERDALLAHLIAHDRVPERPHDTPPEPPAADPKSKERPGETLLGSKGFNCSACHRIGPFEPRNVALGTRGSDLYRLGDRMRQPYFLRWTRSPLRIVPGMEMPSYERPVKGLLHDRLDAQLAAMWTTLNDPKSIPAVDGSSVEQVLAVAPGQPAKVIRDVFRLGDIEPQTWVARPLVVGFSNAQNLLFDVDAASLRLWWSGDLARQRTLGKTWFWEPGAAAFVSKAPVLPEVALRTSTGTLLLPQAEGNVTGRLQGYGLQGSGIWLRYRLSFTLDGRLVPLTVAEVLQPVFGPGDKGWRWRRSVSLDSVPAGVVPILLREPFSESVSRIGPEFDGRAAWETVAVPYRNPDGTTTDVAREALACASQGNQAFRMELRYGAASVGLSSPVSAPTPSPLKPEPVDVLPGYRGIRLPLDRSIMPTAIAWRPDGGLVFCSLKGQVFLAQDTDGDGLEDQLQVFEEGLAAPYGLIADGHDLIVAHKPELLRLKDTDGDGRADVREVLADGWGYSDNYHDWTCGIVRDSRRNLYVGLGSDYAQPQRDRATTKWRGAVLRVDPQGQITPMGFGFRYPTGLAITPGDDVFVSDNQGVQNTFNEINHLLPGGHYGVPSLADDPQAGPVRTPAIQVPHPWTRSVNGLFFLPGGDPAFAGHGIGCEYDSRFLMRFSLQKVGETFQGAAYAFSRPAPAEPAQGFLGTLCGTVSPSGEIYIGSIHDSGWLGGGNVGDLVRLRADGPLPLGIREARAWSQGFELDFTGDVDRTAAASPDNYVISGYTRTWAGAYATPDTGRHTVTVTQATLSGDARRVRLTVGKLTAGHVYEISVRHVAPDGKTPLWPETAHYTLNAIPD